VGAYFVKISKAPNGETTDRIKKVKGCKNGTDLLYLCAKYHGDRGLRAGCRRKSVMFLPTGLREALPCRYCSYSVDQK